MRHGLPLAARATAPQHESERFGRLHDAGVPPKEVDFQQSLRLSRRVPGQLITAPRGLLRHASAADGCAADSRSIDTIHCRSY